MTFWQIYCPVFAALFSSFVVTEFVNFCLGYYLHKKQEKARREFEAKVASGEIDPMQFMFGGGFDPGMNYPMPTISGETKPREGATLGHGQYL